MKLAEKNVLITGAARGIGKATAIELARAGANIIGIDLRDEDLAETATAVTHLGRQFHAYACDISDEAATRAQVAAIIAATGGFDVLVNNAGVLPSGPFLERDFAVWRRAIEINLTGLMALTHIALPHLLLREQAHIVNLASIAGKYGSEGVIAYAASKHGVVGFSSGLREELAHTTVGVSWICPSHARTRLIAGVKPSIMTPEVEPEQVASATPAKFLSPTPCASSWPFYPTCSRTSREESPAGPKPRGGGWRPKRRLRHNGNRLASAHSTVVWKNRRT